MASQPLVEFLATVKATRKANTLGDTRYGKKIDRDPNRNANSFQTLVVTLVLADPDDIRAFDDYTSGPMGLRQVAFRALPPDALDRQVCDPNQVPNDEEDELSRLRRSYVRLLQADEPAAPDAITG